MMLLVYQDTNMSLKHYPKAQTLIETLAAIFILTMGVTAGVGLANFVLGSSTSITNQVIATGLAREAVEAVKSMRDTNWLQANTINTDCYNFSGGTSDGPCYRNWLTQNIYGSVFWGNQITSSLNPPANPSFYILSFIGPDAINPGFPLYWQAPYYNWNLYNVNNTTAVDNICSSHPNGNKLSYALDLSDAPLSTVKFGAGYYTPTCEPMGTSGFYRKITLQTINTPPFDRSDSNNDLAELLVKAQVWWTDNKRCAPSSDWPGLGKCSIEIDTFLTNWRTY